MRVENLTTFGVKTFVISLGGSTGVGDTSSCIVVALNKINAFITE